MVEPGVVEPGVVGPVNGQSPLEGCRYPVGKLVSFTRLNESFVKL